MNNGETYLDSFLAPLAPYLGQTDVTDIWINRPKEVWVECLGGQIKRFDVLGLDQNLLARLARQIAALSSQGISRAEPLLASTLPDGSRVQVVAPPAAREGYAFAIRKHISSNLSLDEWEERGGFKELTNSRFNAATDRTYEPIVGREAKGVLRQAVESRRNIVVSGGTSSGKTTFLNALLAEIPRHERLITIEDTAELRIVHANAVGMLAARGQLAEANVNAEDLLVAALRMRPDRIILGELRSSEAFTFLRAINTGHPGSMTTIHADTPMRAIEQLVLLVIQSGSKLSREDVRRYVQTSIDVFVQLERGTEGRQVREILVAKP